MKTKLKAKDEFKVGKHDIGWISSDFHEYFGEKFEKKEMPKFQKLSRDMIDAEIETELKPGLCELGDILAFLENPPEGSKDDYWNLFYTGSCVVVVGWGAGDREWRVGAWRRGGSGWSAGGQVFSPAHLLPKKLDPMTLEDFVPRAEFEEFKSKINKILKLD